MVRSDARAFNCCKLVIERFVSSAPLSALHDCALMQAMAVMAITLPRKRNAGWRRSKAGRFCNLFNVMLHGNFNKCKACGAGGRGGGPGGGRARGPGGGRPY